MMLNLRRVDVIRVAVEGQELCPEGMGRRLLHTRKVTPLNAACGTLPRTRSQPFKTCG